jgi:putative ABC transport system substrate-binding protein
MKKKSLLPTVATFILASFYLAEGQTVKTGPRIGFISSTGVPNSPSPVFEAFRRGLRDLGYIEGKNVFIDHRYAEGKLDQMPTLVNELVQQKVDVIVAVNNVVIRAAKAATKTIPIVMVSSIDPVAAGYVESFVHPGGNITGLAHLGRDLSGKRVELLREIIPKISRVAILWDADGPGPAIAFKEYEAATRALKLELRSLEVRGANPDFEEAFRTATNARSDAVIVVGNPLIGEHQKRIFELAQKNRLPSMTEDSRYVRAGGLISYGANLAEVYRSAAIYVDAILKGAKAAELRVKQPDVFELFVNLKTAQQIGLTIPKFVLIRANEVIE